MSGELPRLLAGIHGRSLSLDEHEAIHGELPLPGPRRRHDADALIDEVARAGLRGRGGGAFPTARKLQAVRAAGERAAVSRALAGRAVVVVNALEAEPASHKDRVLLQAAPHLPLDGAAIASRAVGANGVIVCVGAAARETTASVQRAIEQRERLPGRGPRYRVVAVVEGYVAGQETALVNHLNGGPPKPLFLTVPLWQRGVLGRPTLVQNVETLAHLALIARHGAEWYRRLGTTDQPGSTLVTLLGPVARPGVYEIEHGASLSSLVAAAGGITEPVRAGLIGGYAGGWVAGERLGALELSRDHLAPLATTLGPGVIALLAQRACPVAQTARLARWMADQGAGQCGPCVNGLAAIADLLERVAAGARVTQREGSLTQLSALVRGRGACAHPDGVARMVDSAVAVFAQELSDHARHGSCAACAAPSFLPLPGDRGARNPVAA